MLSLEIKESFTPVGDLQAGEFRITVEYGLGNDFASSYQKKVTALELQASASQQIIVTEIVEQGLNFINKNMHQWRRK